MMGRTAYGARFFVCFQKGQIQIVLRHEGDHHKSHYITVKNFWFLM